jgi:hypothetical protein
MTAPTTPERGPDEIVPEERPKPAGQPPEPAPAEAPEPDDEG